MSTDESLALEGDYDGTGTASDPFSGSLTYGGLEETESPNGKYFLVGTYIYYSAVAVSFNSTITDGFGLTANGNSFSGTISKAGVIQFLMDGDVYVEFFAIEETVGVGTIDDPYTELDCVSENTSLMELYEENGTSTFYFERGAYINIPAVNPLTYTLENFGWIDTDFEDAGGLAREYWITAGRDVGIITGNIQHSMSFDFIYHSDGSVLTFEFLIPGEPLSPFRGTSGSGTEDDPYSGTLTTTENLSGADYIPSEIWVEAGTEFDVTIFEDGGGTASNITLSEGFGLILNVSKYEGTVTGAANVSGDCVLTNGSMIIGSDSLWTVTFHIVQTYPELVFDSDPVSDSTITFDRT